MEAIHGLGRPPTAGKIAVMARGTYFGGTITGMAAHAQDIPSNSDTLVCAQLQHREEHVFLLCDGDLFDDIQCEPLVMEMDDGDG